MDKHEILYEGTDYANLVLKWGIWKTLDFYSVDSGGDISIELTNSDEMTSFYLDQEGIKLLIDHLQKQIIDHNK